MSLDTVPPQGSEGSEKRRRNRKPNAIYSPGFEKFPTALFRVTPIIKLNLVVEQNKKTGLAWLQEAHNKMSLNPRHIRNDQVVL